MTSYSDKICDGHHTTVFVTKFIIKSIGNQIVSASLPLLEVSSGLEFYYLKNYYVTFKCKKNELD